MYASPKFELEKAAKTRLSAYKTCTCGFVTRVSRLYEQLFLHFLVKVAHESHYF